VALFGFLITSFKSQIINENISVRSTMNSKLVAVNILIYIRLFDFLICLNLFTYLFHYNPLLVMPHV